MENHKKKYLFIYGPLDGGGAERVLLDVLCNFDYDKYEVHLCQYCGGGLLVDEVPEQVVKHTLWSGYTLGYKLAYRASLRFGWHGWLRRQYHKVMDQYGDFDIVISFLEGMPLRIHYLLDIKKSKQVTWVHCDLLRFPYTDNQFREGEQLAAYNAIDTVVCVAKDTEKAFINRFSACTSITKVIYNPIDIDKVLRMSEAEVVAKDKRFTIAMMGRLTPSKKTERFALVARRLKDIGRTNVRFIWIGDGELREQVEQQIRELDVEDIVEITGFKKNPFALLKTADMMFCCSGYEGFCLVVCEAMLLGVPVVSTRTSGPIEILDNGKYGLLCDHDEESMVNAVMLMIDDEELRTHYSEVGRLRVNEFTVDKCMKQIYSL